VPFVTFVHAEGSDPPPPDRRPWEPNWRVWRWLLAALFFGYGVVRAEGAVEVLLLFVVLGLVCRAVDEALPNKDGLREYRQ
jgi:hypothetical protein